jgi:hypothetical protein
MESSGSTLHSCFSREADPITTIQAAESVVGS